MQNSNENPYFQHRPFRWNYNGNTSGCGQIKLVASIPEGMEATNLHLSQHPTPCGMNKTKFQGLKGRFRVHRSYTF